jgi:hypothetical protein
MNGPQRLAHLNMVGIQTTAEEMITYQVNRLIHALYIPIEIEPGRMIYQRDPIRCDHFGLVEEAINWGDLKCSEVRAFADGTYLVTIDEASPDGCPTFCEYIRRHLALQGWICEVQTEW